MTWTNRAFALTFFVGRVVVCGLGLLHLFRSWDPHVEEAAWWPACASSARSSSRATA